MSLSVGERLAQYEILSSLGAGGMGEVYRARDSKLGREVAIKVLPEEFTQHPQKLARFEREARLLAALNHPGIATLYGVEEAENQPFLVMELVEGETLAERIARGPVPVNEALQLSQQIAEALEAAHEKGVIHRDLKPANIKVDPEGKVKVLDFGLAKAFADEVPESEPSQSPTLSRDATRAGVILGTAAYMSPEQAKANRVDRRADIWAFGVVLFEMLTATRLFEREDVSETLAAVLRAEPDLDELPSGTPPGIRRLLRRTLRKNPRERLADIRDARIEIDDVLETPHEDARDSRSFQQPLGFALAGLLVGAIVSFTIWRPARLAPPAVARYTIAPLEALSNDGPPAWSPDGTFLVYPARLNGVSQLVRWLRAENEHTPLRGTEGAAYPFFSPDGRWIGFFADDSLKKIPVEGGPSQTLCPAGSRYGANWGADDTIVFASTAARGLMRVPAGGGEPQALTPSSDEGRHTWPQWLPGGKALLFTVTGGGPVSDKRVATFSLKTGEQQVLLDGTHARYAPSGHLIFAREASLWAAPFDVERLQITGTPTPVIEGVQVNSGGGMALFDLASDGSLAYWTGVSSESFLIVYHRQGQVTLERELESYDTPRFSPDGRRIAMRLDGDIWTYDTSRRTEARLTMDGGSDPIWTPDGTHITYVGPDRAIYSKPAHGSGEAQLLAKTRGQVFPGAWTPDGDTLMLQEYSRPSQLYLVRKGGSIEAFRPSPTPYSEGSPAFSPDGRWLLYTSDETGRSEVYLQPYPGLGGRTRVSLDGGTYPRWTREGQEIVFLSRGRLMAVPFDGTPSTNQGQPREILGAQSAPLADSARWRDYDPSPDGESFVVLESPSSEGTGEFHVVLNWLSEVSERVPIE